MKTTISGIRKAGALLFAALALLTQTVLMAQTEEQISFEEEDDQVSLVETVRDEDGWRLTVDGFDFPVKGVVWAFTPIGENYNYNLWGKPDAFIEKMIDTDMILLKKMGVNAIRCFSMIPPKWVAYIYDRYGIYTMVNDLFGRYGVTVNGKWHPSTDYSDPDTRVMLLEQAKKTVLEYRNTRGVLMYMLGNESNYGLEWTSGAIENLPSGERLEAKARYLYSLFGEAIRMIKDLDPKHPVGLINGDLQYLQIMKEEAPDLDILGVNTYRGKKAFGLFYQSVAETLNKPLVYTEMGADAYNVALEQEDQYNQADFLLNQWEEIYQQSYGKGRNANVLGAFVFEWIDEWWKHGMETGLEDHDTQGTWNNGGYDFDSVPGKNNMNEEWFGIVAQSPLTEDGINRRIPRAAYYLLQQIWTLDMFFASNEEVADHFGALRISEMVAVADGKSIREDVKRIETFKVSGDLTFRGFVQWTDQSATDLQVMRYLGEINRMETGRLGFSWEPIESFKTGMDIRLFGEPFTTSYTGAEAETISFMPVPAEAARPAPGASATISGELAEPLPVEIYSAYAEYENELLRADFYYHTGHPDWAAEGDFFGLLPEAFDLYHMDLDGSKAPFGFEVGFKQELEGLKLYAGPELFAGAFPMVMAKYYRDFGALAFGALANAELFYPNGYTTQQKQDRYLTTAASLYADIDLLPVIRIEAGALLSRPEHMGRTFTTAVPSEGSGMDGSGYDIVTDNVLGFAEALGGKIKLSTTVIPYVQLYIQGVLMGAVADGRGMIARGGTQIVEPGTGNRWDAEAGLSLIVGPFTLSPKFLYRQPLYDAVPDLSDADPRNYTDAFFVWGNRKTVAAEAILTFDPTGATWFHNWDNDDREDAVFAGSVSFLYNFYQGPTDASRFFDAAGNILIWPQGLSEVFGTWSLTARFVSNPLPGLRFIASGNAGLGQSTGNPDEAPINYGGFDLRVALFDRLMIDGGMRFDAWGPPQWHREFGITYPLQWNTGLSFAFEDLSFMEASNRVGLSFTGRTYGDKSPAAESDDGALASRFEMQAYVNFSF